MIERILPPVADNRFAGPRLALWLFGIVTFIRGLIGLRSVLSAAQIAQGADGIPLASFPATASAEIISTFALLGLGNLVTAVLGVLVLWRYRALVPLMFLIQLGERLARTLIKQAYPGAPPTPGAPGDVVVMVIVGLLVAGFALSLWRRPGAG